MFSAGQVAVVLQGNFSPIGFMAFDGAMKKSAATMKATEAKLKASSAATAAATTKMGTSAALAAGLYQDAAGRWRNASGQFASASEKAAAGVEKSSHRMGSAMAKAGKAAKTGLAVGVLAAGYAIYKSVSAAAEFEQQLSRLKATTNASGAQMQRFKKDAMAAGAATKFSALDAVEAQNELAKGGLAVKDMSGGLTAALNLAAAGEMDLTEAAEATVNTMKQFKLAGADAAHIADALSTASLTTTADVSHFTQALTQGGAAAKSAGMSLDETLAILEAFADNSVKGSDAGTSLKTMLTQLANPTDKQKSAAKSLNLELWDQKERLKSLPQMAKALDSAFGGLTDKQRLAAAATIAGTDGMRGLIAMYDSSPAAMQGYLDGLKKEGTAAEMAAEKQDNLKGKVENLKGSLETAGIQLGEGLLPGLTKGAEGITDAINGIVESGDLEQLGQDLGAIVELLGTAAPTGLKVAVEGIGIAAKGLTLAFIPFVSALAGGLTIITAMVDAFNALPLGFDINSDGLAKARDDAKALVEAMTNTVLGRDTEVKIKIKGDESDAVAALKRVQGMGLSAKVMKILGKDGDAKSKIKALIDLGIPPKLAKILANNADAISKIGSVQAALNSLQSSKTITITTVSNEIRNLVDRRTPSNITNRKPKPEATGSAGGYSRTALVGEGRGPELVTDGRSSVVVNQPTLMDLGPEHSVIPYGDPGQKGRALGLMLDLFGIKGYDKGKKGHTHGKGKPKALPIPDAVKFGAVPSDELDKSRDDAREGYQDRKERVRKLDIKIKDQARKVSDAKTPDAKRKARRDLAKLREDRTNYRDGKGGIKSSLAEMKQRWMDLQRQAQELNRVNREIERLNTQQETDRTKMATASKTGDVAAWTNAKNHRAGLLGTLRDKYALALKYAKPDTNFQAELEGKLATIQGDIADLGGEAFVSPFEGGLNADERRALEGLEAAQSLAALTAGTDDDRAAAGSTLGFLEGVLGAVRADPSRGGAAAIRDIADRVKQARDNVASFTGGAGNDNADLQAQLDQSREATRVAIRAGEINRLGLATFQGAGDIGMGPRITINTLHPGDSRTLEAISNASNAGNSMQASVKSPRTRLGL